MRTALTAIRRRLTTSAANTTTKHLLRHLSPRDRTVALRHAQQAVTDYLHQTRRLPFAHAEQIGLHSPASLKTLLSSLRPTPSSPSDFPRSVSRFLSFNPLNEFDFFFESIGLSPAKSDSPSRDDVGFFLSEDARLLPSTFALAGLGFPWTRLGLLYAADASVFVQTPEELRSRMRRLESMGLGRMSAIGVCLAFPFVLGEKGEDFVGLERVLVDFDLGAFKGKNVEEAYELGRKIRFFYDLGLGRADDDEARESIRRNRDAFLSLDHAVLVEKVGFLRRFDLSNEDIASIVLQSPSILKLDLESPIDSILDYLKWVGLDDSAAAAVVKRSRHVLGKNNLRNLPATMKAADLQSWFARALRSGGHERVLLAIPSFRTPSVENADRRFQEGLAEAATTSSAHPNPSVLNRVDFLRSVGFGENEITLRAAMQIHGRKERLRERFELLLRAGFGYARLTRMVRGYPKILNNSPEALEEKVEFVRGAEYGGLIEEIEKFPMFLCFDLANRVRARYAFLEWLRQKEGVVVKRTRLATVVATSENAFLGMLFKIHPAAPKQWLEAFRPRGRRAS
ncbi:hypothetical protein QJS04_geneDACA018424 [Acorus gramineus]|uniref:Uncharacterized protein n=1 Tax=Acorus gramineus TaxID=55184 RepID=A0AAV9AEH0_ACOGR|nr:hypothetical protein QJS04_geneDACA018424 [Acorus gramineus]